MSDAPIIEAVNDRDVIANIPVVGQIAYSRLVSPNEYEYAVDVGLPGGVERWTGLRRCFPRLLGSAVDYDPQPEGTACDGTIVNGILYMRFYEPVKGVGCDGTPIGIVSQPFAPPTDGSPGAPGGGFSPPPGIPTGGGPGGGGSGGESSDTGGGGGSVPSEGGGGGGEASQ